MAGSGSDLQAPSALCFLVASLYNPLSLLMKPQADVSLTVYDYLFLYTYLTQNFFLFPFFVHVPLSKRGTPKHLFCLENLKVIL